MVETISLDEQLGSLNDAETQSRLDEALGVLVEDVEELEEEENELSLPV